MTSEEREEQLRIRERVRLTQANYRRLCREAEKAALVNASAEQSESSPEPSMPDEVLHRITLALAQESRLRARTQAGPVLQ